VSAVDSASSVVLRASVVALQNDAAEGILP